MSFLKNAKKKVSQNDLRRVMNEHKKKLTAVARIESPIAKYTDSGQLICILCQSIVRNETVWNIHLNSKTHKENITLAKKSRTESSQKQIPQSGSSPSQSFKRPSSPTNSNSNSNSSNKKLKIKSILKSNNAVDKSSLPDDFFDNKSTNNPSVNDNRSNLKNKESKKKADNKESEINEDVEMTEDVKDDEKDTQAPLPEGFFDDPIMDAKVRNVEYKDPIEEEWEKFQKEIKEETAQSAQIIADDQEEATTERQLDEIEEQMRHWSRVLELERRKEQVQEQVERKSVTVQEDLSSGDETEFDEFLDWRAKKSYK